jgi:sugar phosphate isomerase/epimerase
MNPITFSTLACPGWSVETIITKAVEFGYDGLEWRGGPDGHVRPTMASRERTALRRMSEDSGLLALAVTAYTSFVSDDPAERQESVDELRHHADLAAELGASYVRAFLGELPEGTTLMSSIYQNILDSLNRASEHAASVGVQIAVEPHDDFTRSSVIAPIFAPRVTRPDLRVIWDIGNTFAVGEEPAEGFALLKDHLAYVQVKDGQKLEAGWQLCSLGQGNVPLSRAFELLSSHGYQGAYSVEWEYAWHPELDPPENALPAALQIVRQLLTASQTESA